jgi:hypothetical protein
MSRMDPGAAHELRHELARTFERDLRAEHREAKASGDRDRAAMIEDEFARRGISI